MIKKINLNIFIFLIPFFLNAGQKVSLFYFTPVKIASNFGDALSPKIIERIIKRPLIQDKNYSQRMLALGSILHFLPSNSTSHPSKVIVDSDVVSVSIFPDPVSF